MLFLLRKRGAGLESDSILAHVPSMYINLIPAVDAAGYVSTYGRLSWNECVL